MTRTMELSGSDVVDVVNAVMAWFYMNSPVDQVRAIFDGNQHPSYIEEKVVYAKRSPISFWGSLDRRNQAKLIALALEDWSRSEHEEEAGQDPQGDQNPEGGDAGGQAGPPAGREGPSQENQEDHPQRTQEGPSGRGETT